MRLEMKAMFEEYLGKKSPELTDPNTTPSVDLPLAKVKPSNNGSPSTENNGALPKENDGLAKGASIPPPNTYSTLQVHYPMPHINYMGSPPKLDTRNFIKRQGLMKYHISNSSTHLWRVIQNGFAPHDLLNLTGREEVDEQLNATAKHLLQQAMPDTHAAHINNLSTAKEVWDYLTMLFVGNDSIWSSKFDELKSEERDFIMQDNETPDEMYQRILAFAMALTGFGCKENGDDYIKRMFITSINPREPIRSKIIRSGPDFGCMTSNEVLCEFTALTILKKIAEETRVVSLPDKESTIFLSRPRRFTSKKM
jgi:hypothetical protein